jgi:phytoene dehydrogenase-like protein
MRPFRGLGIHEDPAPEYDAIVIGAGLGGLACANLLAEAGLKVLLAEQHYVVGGYCSSFSRQGFRFDAASHFYPLLGNRETITGRLLERLGVETEWVKMDPVDHFHFPDGSRYSVPADFDRYLRELKEMFPAEAARLDAFFAEVRMLYLIGLLRYFRGKMTDRLRLHEGVSLRTAIDRHFEDRKLKLLLTADCPHWGAPPRRISYVFDSMLRLSYFLGNYYPRGGSQKFADDLASALERAGGDVVLRAHVRQIRLDRGRVAGVELELGPVNRRRRVAVRSTRVISNADLLQTCSRLLREEHFEAGLLGRLRRMRRSYPCYLMHLGLAETSPEELYDAQGYHWSGWDAEALGTTDLRFKFFVPTQFDSSIAPPGSQIIIIQKVIEMEFEKIEDWENHKAEIDAFVWQHLERLVPRIAERARVRLSASAKTSYRYTLNTAGAMLGWEMSPDQLGDDRPSVVGSVEGLYYTGHWTRPGGGVTPVLVSAMKAAEAITGNRYF